MPYVTSRNLVIPGDNKKSWRGRFTLKALFVLITLACVTLAGWEGTKRYAEEERNALLLDTYALTPFVLQRDSNSKGTRKYFLWFFGWTIRIPYEEQIPIFDGSDGFGFP